MSDETEICEWSLNINWQKMTSTECGKMVASEFVSCVEFFFCMYCGKKIEWESYEKLQSRIQTV